MRIDKPDFEVDIDHVFDRVQGRKDLTLTADTCPNISEIISAHFLGEVERVEAYHIEGFFAEAVRSGRGREPHNQARSPAELEARNNREILRRGIEGYLFIAQSTHEAGWPTSKADIRALTGGSSDYHRIPFRNKMVRLRYSVVLQQRKAQELRGEPQTAKIPASVPRSQDNRLAMRNQLVRDVEDLVIDPVAVRAFIRSYLSAGQDVRASSPSDPERRNEGSRG